MTGVQTMNYPLTPDPRDVRFLAMGTLVGAVTIISVVWILFATGIGGLSAAIINSLFIGIWEPILVFAYSRARFGSIAIDNDGVALRKRFVRDTYSWANIKSLTPMEGRSASLPLIGALTGSSNNYSYVEMKLRRSARMGFLLTRGGTEVAGIPLGVKTLRMITPNPRAVVDAAEPFMRSEAAE